MAQSPWTAHDMATEDTWTLQVVFSSSILPTSGYRPGYRFLGGPIALHGLVHCSARLDPPLLK